MIKYCLPIVVKEKVRVTQLLEYHAETYQYFEIWLDYINKFDLNFIEDLSNKWGDRLIFILRRKEFEEPIISLKDRLNIIRFLSKSKSLLDLDIFEQSRELRFYRDEQLSTKEGQLSSQLLLSYHNYQETPSLEKLRDIIVEMESYSPMIYKVATHCNHPKDALRLMTLQLSQEGRRVIVLGMGQDGAITRIFGALWGNYLSFVPLKKSEETASGQYTKEELEGIFKLINHSVDRK